MQPRDDCEDRQAGRLIWLKGKLIMDKKNTPKLTDREIEDQIRNAIDLHCPNVAAVTEACFRIKA
jgi:hypothetical protein